MNYFVRSNKLGQARASFTTNVTTPARSFYHTLVPMDLTRNNMRPWAKGCCWAASQQAFPLQWSCLTPRKIEMISIPLCSRLMLTLEKRKALKNLQALLKLNTAPRTLPSLGRDRFGSMLCLSAQWIQLKTVAVSVGSRSSSGSRWADVVPGRQGNLIK